MRIVFEDQEYEGSPADIVEALWEDSFIRDEFHSTEDFLEYMRGSFERMTDIPCSLPNSSLNERAKAMLEYLASIDAAEIVAP